jgi:hypothetical protein
LKRFLKNVTCLPTGLKSGVNETTFEASCDY